jgi:trigger factor
MEYTVETISQTKRKIKVSVEREVVEKEMNRILKELQRNVEIKGFRKGKAPVEIIMNYYGESAKKEAMENTIKSTLSEVLKKEGLNPLRPPVIEEMLMEEKFNYTVRFDVLPKIEPSGYEKMKVKIKDWVVTEKEVDAVIDDLRRKHGTLKPVEERNIVRENDVLEVVPTDGKEKGKLLIVEKGDEFEGKKIGDVVRVNEKELKILKIYELILPEANDEFARTLGASDFLNLRKKIMERLELDRKRVIKTRLQNAIFEHLIKVNNFEAPESLVLEEGRRLKEELKRDDPSLLGLAEDRVKSEILLHAIAEKENIKAEEGEIKEELQKLANETKKRFEVLSSNAELKRRIEDSIIRKKTMEFLEKRCEVEYERE